MDRRILKTRSAIKKAFIELMAEKKFEEITINQISERANLNRGTIYLHSWINMISWRNALRSTPRCCGGCVFRKIMKITIYRSEIRCCWPLNTLRGIICFIIPCSTIKGCSTSGKTCSK
ncbi:TetR/AcrR family transcriptional regulator [Paenibacillus sp. JW14]|uniref:TetR/AcrR family transcriptional regulator n=1 Tax=Paenibacillus agri TaxID=2744309 RepID=A0A850EKR8_9BACL|nr:TetR/AcrR family transcriptional regulator [Paenibacillus agri]